MCLSRKAGPGKRVTGKRGKSLGLTGSVGPSLLLGACSLVPSVFLVFKMAADREKIRRHFANREDPGDEVELLAFKKYNILEKTTMMIFNYFNFSHP